MTLTLAWWSAMFRVIWVTFVISWSDSLDVGWLSVASEAPPILGSLAAVVFGLLVMTAGCLLEPRNRTRTGYALAGINCAFAVLLGAAVFLHASFALEVAAHRASGAPSGSNLAREIAGRWQVVARDEPVGAPRFPATVHWIERNPDRLRITRGASSTVDAWWSLEATPGFRPTTRLFARLEHLLFGTREVPLMSFEPRSFEGAWYERPALLIHALIPPRIEVLPSNGYCVWAAELHEPNTRTLELVTVQVNREPVPISRVVLRRADAPETGRDLAEELAQLRETPLWR
ncbi:MAG TPA: hypothetical protein VFT98_15430 [Myxococcota bacterium]|nr:hypothetical protein [Myxococcota bacterium]